MSNQLNERLFSGPTSRSVTDQVVEKNSICSPLSMDKSAVDKEKEKKQFPPFPCAVCGKSFSSKYTLKRHYDTLHPGYSLDYVIRKSIKRFKCDICELQFSHVRNLKFHKRKQHMDEIVAEQSLVCPLCRENIKKSVIVNHFSDNHNIEMENNEFKFPTLDKFKVWKAEIENTSNSKYVMYGSKSQTSYFRCHRSGNFYSKGNGKRRLKMLGSNKINAYCPAGMKVTETKGGECLVTFQSTHVGHDQDLNRLFLTNDERNFIASKIAANIPFDRILDDIRDSVTHPDLQRLQLLKRKDLHNIKNSLSCSSVKHKENTEVFINDEIYIRKNNTVSDMNRKEPNHSTTQNINSLIMKNNPVSDINKKELSHSSTIRSINHSEKKEFLIKRYTELIQSFSTPEQCDFMEKNFKSVVKKLNALTKKT